MKVIYHRADLDGIGSAALVYIYFSEQVINLSHEDFIGFDYVDNAKDIINKISPNEDVIMVDCSFEPFDDMVELYNKTNKITWIDHHRSALLNFDKFRESGKIGELAGLRPEYPYDNSESAISLVWKYFFKSEVPLFVEYISKLDTWNHNYDQNIINFYTGAQIHLKSIFSDKWLSLVNDNFILFQEIKQTGNTIVEYMANENKLICNEGAFDVEILGYKGIALNTPFRGSHQLASVYDNNIHDFMLVFTFLGNRWRYSIYSENNPNFDASKIAKHFNGGGHINAAGFSTTELIDEIKNVKIL